MSSEEFWADACKHAMERPLQTQLGAAYASCGITVGPACAAADFLDSGF
jgi:hypothetical protein